MKRLPLFEKKNEKKVASIRCEAIAEELTDYCSGISEPGLMNGLSGISLFFFHYYRLTGDKKYQERAYNALKVILDSIDKGFSHPSFATGLAGIHWLFQYLGKKGFISSRDANSLLGLKPMFLAFSKNQFNLSHYDYFHGALGTFTALYDGFERGDLYRPPETESLLNIIKNELIRLAILEEDNSAYWESADPIAGHKEINLGLAHGIPSILLMLSRVYRITKDEDILKDLVKPGMKFLLKNRRDLIDQPSLFPTRIVKGIEKRPSRMAWCYGDPGIALAIMQIGENCRNTEWISFGSSTLLKSTTRRSQNDTFISDACLCHGSSGLALIYYYAGLKTGNSSFFAAADYWSKVTLNFGSLNKSAVRYLFKGNNNEFRPQYSLLNGISGVGLFLIARLEGELPGWEEGLLIK